MQGGRDSRRGGAEVSYGSAAGRGVSDYERGRWEAGGRAGREESGEEREGEGRGKCVNSGEKEGERREKGRHGGIEREASEKVDGDRDGMGGRWKGRQGVVASSSRSAGWSKATQR